MNSSVKWNGLTKQIWRASVSLYTFLPLKRCSLRDRTYPNGWFRKWYGSDGTHLKWTIFSHVHDPLSFRYVTCAIKRGQMACFRKDMVRTVHISSMSMSIFLLEMRHTLSNEFKWHGVRNGDISFVSPFLPLICGVDHVTIFLHRNRTRHIAYYARTSPNAPQNINVG